MKWQCLQHAPFEGPAYLQSWVHRRGHSLQETKLWTGVSLPALDSFDGLFILGGPMNVYQENRHPWLREEKALISRAVEAGKAILGICLGAQLLSVVLGGRVSRNPFQEIGWHPVEVTPQGRETRFFSGFPQRFLAFHWHGDRLAIPRGAIHAATSSGCAEQAFVYRDHVVALQFHLESTPESISELIRYCGDEITPGPFVQEPALLRKQTGPLETAHSLLDRLLDTLAALS